MPVAIASYRRFAGVYIHSNCRHHSGVAEAVRAAVLRSTHHRRRADVTGGRRELAGHHRPLPPSTFLSTAPRMSFSRRWRLPSRMPARRPGSLGRAPTRSTRDFLSLPASTLRSSILSPPPVCTSLTRSSPVRLNLGLDAGLSAKWARR